MSLDRKGARIFLSGIKAHQDSRSEVRAEAFLEAADALDKLWDQRKGRLFEGRDWADGVEEAESLIRELAAKEIN